jgi:hypothetical protein
MLTLQEDVEHMDMAWPPEQSEKKTCVEGAWNDINRKVEYVRTRRGGIIRPKTVNPAVVGKNLKLTLPDLQNDEFDIGEPLARYVLNTYPAPKGGGSISGYLTFTPSGISGKSGTASTGPEIPVVVVHPFERAVSAKLPTSLTKMAGPDQASLNELLKSLDPQVSEVRVGVNDANRGVVQIDHNLLGRIPIEFQGAGFVKAVSMGCLVIEASNGVLIADDFDACLHPGAQPKIIEFLLRAALKHNVQLFAATHSLETLDTFLDKCAALKESGVASTDLCVLQLRRDGDKSRIKSIPFDGVQTLRVELGVDLRRTG